MQEKLDLPPDDIYGTPPPASVQNWMRLSLLGDRHHPFLVVWISPQNFLRRGFERLLTLSPAKYDSLTNIAHSLRCSKPVQPYPEEHRLLVTIYSAATESQCVLSLARSCKFLAAVAAISEVRTSKYYRESLHILASDADCSVPK
jgi:hypothetical protein